MVIGLDKIDTMMRQQWLQSAIAPRPVGLMSTLDKDGHPNLAPFSFFNLFSADPPVAIFSLARIIRDNSVKHSFLNLYEVPEVVINFVDYTMLHRVNLASAEFPVNENEFIKSGLTMEPATVVRPFMVKESKIKFECKVKELKPLGKDGGAGNLVICELLKMHIHETILDENNQIDPYKLELVARLGYNWYCTVSQNNLFELTKPINKPIGVDKLPASLKESKYLKAEELAQLAGVPAIQGVNVNTDPFIHKQVAAMLNIGDVQKAWELLISAKEIL